VVKKLLLKLENSIKIVSNLTVSVLTSFLVCPAIWGYMMISTEDLTHLFHKHIAQTGDDLPNLEPTRCIEAIEEILCRNVESGRFQRAQKHHRDNNLTMEQYAVQVIQHFLQSYDKVSNLQAGWEDEWQTLWDILYKAAYRQLIRYGWDRERAEEKGKELTQEACSIIYHQRTYPYDCSFNAWALLILQNFIKRQTIRSRNPLDLPEQRQLDGEANLQNDRLIDSNLDVYLQTVGESDQLGRAIQELLSPAQRQVIIDIFFIGYSPAEVATRLDRTVEAVYLLKHQALKKLRNILTLEKDLVAQ
jgi:RNA polymerase sigma factor (sigma-70 family)